MEAGLPGSPITAVGSRADHHAKPSPIFKESVILRADTEIQKDMTEVEDHLTVDPSVYAAV